VDTLVSRFVAAPRSRVYAALLDPAAVQRWMVPDDMTSEVHRFEPWEGGTFAITLTYDAPTAAGKTGAHSDTSTGRFVRLVQDAEVVQVVAFETDDPDVRGEMTITYRLEDAPGGTLVHGLHQDLPTGVSAADNELGWTMALRKLAELVEGA
jgi:uncharacterized protein YndB with AHSA1/START domain